MDKYGWLYFKDRVGDTFRWKGENVSTQEVEAVVSSVLGLADTTVYGVLVPNADGRAGMAAVPAVPEQAVDGMLEKLRDGLREKLPAYARPIFVRFVNQIELTGAWKETCAIVHKRERQQKWERLRINAEYDLRSGRNLRPQGNAPSAAATPTSRSLQKPTPAEQYSSNC